MIEKLILQNFKCFESQEMKLSAMTLLCGLNGMGKSSLMQSILLLRQSFDKDQEIRRLLLNGNLIHLGNGKDILFESASEDVISITLIEDSGEVEVKVAYNPSLDLLEIISSTVNSNSVIFSQNLKYINAERIGPRISSAKEDTVVELEKSTGHLGEFVSHFMHRYGEQIEVDIKVRHKNASSSSLASNVEAWMSEISPGVQIKFEEHDQIDQVSTSFSFVNKGGVSNQYRPTNVGFGISYVLPVVVALLASAPGSSIIIENPEAHIHPRGQRQLGELMSKVSSSGVQVIVETHSDHVLNGIRLSVKDGVLEPEMAVFNFFHRAPFVDVSSSITALRIDKDGRFEEWPEGFFDEWDEALDRLL